MLFLVLPFVPPPITFTTGFCFSIRRKRQNRLTQDPQTSKTRRESKVTDEPTDPKRSPQGKPKVSLENLVLFLAMLKVICVFLLLQGGISPAKTDE